MFKDFSKRLQRDIKRFTDYRTKRTIELSEGRLQPQPIDVNVISHHMQRFAVWFGGSMLASTVRFEFQMPLTKSQPEFFNVCHTKAQYDEKGPAICRHNPVFGAVTQ